MKQNRRNFIKKSTISIAGYGAMSMMPTIKWAGKVAPNDRVNVALIGCRNMGFGLLNHFLNQDDAQCIALCDIDENILNERAAEIRRDFDQSPALYRDFRRMLENRDIDAVIVATPDHWHCLQAVYSLQAGKHVYVEKPLANTIEECNIMVAASKRYNQVVQVGQQQRSGFVFQKAMELVKNGEIGKLRKVNIWANFSYGVGPQVVEDSPVPDGVDYDMWLGPAPKRPFNRNRFHGNWRHFWDYGGGLASDWGVHLVDIALWADDAVRAPDKVLVYADNTYGEERARESFDSMSINYPKKGFAVNYDLTAGLNRGPWDMLYGIAFASNDATMVMDRTKLIVYPEYDNQRDEYRAEEYQYTEGEESHGEHVRNFLDCIKTGDTPACTPEIGRASALHLHIANIAGRVGEPVLYWDDTNNRFTNSEAANELIAPQYRQPWTLPRI